MHHFLFKGKLAKYFLVLNEARALELYTAKFPNAKDVNNNKFTKYKRPGGPISESVPSKK